jgi:hypothetical protein
MVVASRMPQFHYTRPSVLHCETFDYNYGASRAWVPFADGHARAEPQIDNSVARHSPLQSPASATERASERSVSPLASVRSGRATTPAPWRILIFNPGRGLWGGMWTKDYLPAAQPHG